MRRIVTAITAAAMALSLVSFATPAYAAAGFDSAYAGESAFLTLNPGQSGTFTVFFANTGTTSWVRGTATQVDLAACLEDKVTCNAQDASEAPFNDGTWLSATRYATHTQTTVAPGSIGTFTYNVKVPAAGTTSVSALSHGNPIHRFNGALVVSSTGADVHNEGYYQDVNVPVVTPSCTVGSLTTTPKFANEVVGASHAQAVTVLCADGTTKAANVGVTVTVDAPAGSLNADLTLTATTDANGTASVTWSRANPGVDDAAAYVTATPSIRDTATVQWSTAVVISCTPTTAATQTNATSRIFTVTVRNALSGATVAAGVAVDITVSTKITSGTANIDGTTAVGVTAGDTVVQKNTDGNGNITFTADGSNATIEPVVFLDAGAGTNTNNNKLNTDEFRATCGKTTFSVLTATIAVTPDAAASVASGAQKVYTISATDQSGSPFTGTVRVSFTQLTDASLATSTSARVVWYDTDLAPDRRTSASASSSSNSRCASVPVGTFAAATNAKNTGTGTISVANPGQIAQFALGTDGGATFAICSDVVDDVGTPHVFQDINGDTGVGADEPQDTGGATTWVAEVLTSGLLFAGSTAGSSATNPRSCTTFVTDFNSQCTTTTLASDNNGSAGEETFTFRLRDQSNNKFSPTTTNQVIFTVQNTGSNTVFVTDVDGASAVGGTIAPGASAQFTANLAIGDNDATIELDAADPTSAKVTATLVANSSITGTATKTWVAVQEEANLPAGDATATGTVISLNTGSNATDGGSYVLQTGVGNMRITYANLDAFVVTGTTTNELGFENNLSIGDTVKWTRTGVAEKHEITTNQ